MLRILVISMSIFMLAASFSCARRSAVKHERSTSESRDSRINDKLDRLDRDIEKMDNEE